MEALSRRRRCKRCPAELLIVRNGDTGNWQALDAEPDPERGNIVLDEHDRAHVVGRFAAAQLRSGGEELYIDHHATCPFASEFRK